MQLSARNCIVSAVVAVAALSAQSLMAKDPTDSQCEVAWASSDAHNSCGFTYLTGEGKTKYVWAVDTSQFTARAYNNACQVAVSCLRTSNRAVPIDNVFNGTPGEVDSLSNCDGTLKTSSC